MRKKQKFYPGQTTAWRIRDRERRAGYPPPERCEVCGGLGGGNRDGGSRLHFDHDHETGEFRGWLCRQCNMALGLLKDDPLRLEALARYLRRQSNA